jgi:hypothetical protein
MQAELAPGDAAGPAPCEGDLAFVHVTIKAASGAALFSTRREDGGAGSPLAFLIGKGRRAPRSWELALLGEAFFGLWPARHACPRRRSPLGL